jgi:amino acid transporter
MAYAALWVVCVACLLVTYYLVAVATKLNNPWLAWVLMPVAFLYDIFILHTSLLKYEFGQVQWKGRNVTKPDMQTGRLPHAS